MPGADADMSHKQPLTKILTNGRAYWDRAETRSVVRREFDKVLKCRTSALGAEVYESHTERETVYHTCKSRACPSCGHRATLLWQREQFAALPAVPYKGIVLTMPDVLWPIFRRNRHLLHDLPMIGADVIQQWAKDRHGVRLIIVVVLHTFGRGLNFNCHLHILVSAGGLQESQNRWLPSIYYHRDTLMQKWRDAVVSYLSEALAANVLVSESGTESLGEVLKAQGQRWWNIRVHGSETKEHFLRYAGRYVRHPPIAQRRITKVTDGAVEFWKKDLRLKRQVNMRYSIEEFVAVLADHVPDHYRHAIRYYGLWAPGSRARASAAIFALLRQQQRSRPRRLSWRRSLQTYFGRDPLIDRHGQYMHWVRRLKPCLSKGPG
jgi:Putative transposase/Transposase zinc-binding domain